MVDLLNFPQVVEKNAAKAKCRAKSKNKTAPSSTTKLINYSAANYSAPESKKDVQPEHRFFLCDGTYLNNLLELAAALKYMKEETFSHHVSEQKNDFANWIRHCMGEEELAAKLEKYKTKTGHEIQVLRYIAKKIG